MYFSIREKTLILWYLSTVSPRELRFPRTQFPHLAGAGGGGGGRGNRGAGKGRGGGGESGENNSYSYKIFQVPK